ncbi:MAG: hypothetical protein FWC32_10955 [Firmicutes bacterium]|nr:hypothetical protein [Bacillota bacterium]
MYHDNLKDLEYALRFTEVYQNEPDVSLREAKCLQMQVPYVLNPIREEDLIVGTMSHGYVGFSPQYGGVYTYYFHDDRVAAALNSVRDNVSENFITKVEEMRRFWQTENTEAKAAARFHEKYDVPRVGSYYIASCRIAGMNVDLDLLVTLGLCGLKERVTHYRMQNGESSFYDALDISIDTIADACKHYAAEAKTLASSKPQARRDELLEISQIFDKISAAPPETFKEALQLVWIYSVCSCLMNYGRMDNYLGDFYARDIDSGRLTEEEAIRRLSSLYRNIMVVGKIHDSRILFGGYGRKNPKAADRLAMALIKTSRVVKETVPQLTMRYYTGMDQRLIDETLINIQEGAVYPIIYSDETTVPAIEHIYQVDREMACNWVPLGCGEYILEGYGAATPNTALFLPAALNLVLHRGVNSFTGEKEIHNMPDPASFDTFEDLFAAYDNLLKPMCQMQAYHEQLNYQVAGEAASFLHHSLLTRDCVEKGRGLFSGGVRYLAATNEIFGLITCADSLTAIKHCAYDEKYFTMAKLVEMLNANFEGYTAERKQLLNAPKYGNDNDRADAMAARVSDHIADLIEEAGRGTNLHTYNACSVNNSGSAEFGATVGATPCGRLKGQAFSNGNSPSLGADKSGLTATLNSMAKIDAKRHVGATHNIRFDKKMLTENRDAIKTVLITFYENNGTQTNLSAVGKHDLERALTHPEEYKDLIVRIGGFSARFVELAEIVQRELIARTTYERF